MFETRAGTDFGALAFWDAERESHDFAGLAAGPLGTVLAGELETVAIFWMWGCLDSIRLR